MNNEFDTQVQKLKYSVLKEVAESYWNGTLLLDISSIPTKISPGPKPTMRCCIYKERTIASERVKLAIGGDKLDPNMLEVIESACNECPIGGITISNACMGCLAHRCAQACPKDAILFDENLRARIDKAKCINCGLCMKACPYGAILNYRRPCEVACKVDAVKENEDGICKIEESKCTRCGACSYACPFGAIMDKSYILNCIDLLKEGKKDHKDVYMIVAPTISVQFRGVKIGQVVSGIKKLGFNHVVEAALGADIVAMGEAKELSKKGALVSSCCTAFVKYVKTSYPELSDMISTELSPMATIAKFYKEKDPNCLTVFVGPCISKKMEMFEGESAKYVDCVITFEELRALFDARGIDLSTLTESPLEGASYFGRIFARCGGLSEAVKEALKEQKSDFIVKPKACNGLDECIAAIKLYKSGKADFNFIEGMACKGGCIGGPACLTHELRDLSDINKAASLAKGTIKEAIDEIK